MEKTTLELLDPEPSETETYAEVEAEIDIVIAEDESLYVEEPDAEEDAVPEAEVAEEAPEAEAEPEEVEADEAVLTVVFGSKAAAKLAIANGLCDDDFEWHPAGAKGYLKSEVMDAIAAKGGK